MSQSQDSLTAPDAGDTNPLAEAGQETGERAAELATRAKDTATQQANVQKERVATGLDNAAGAIRRLSDDLDADQPMIGDIADTAADQTERIAAYLRETDVTQMIRGVEDFARRQPLLFLGGAFAAGVLAARFLKAAGGGQGRQDARRQVTWQHTDAWRPVGPEWEATGPGASSTLTGTRGRELSTTPDLGR